jgi:hypothetical protein
MPYNPKIGMTIWIGGTILALVLGLTDVMPRDAAAVLALIAFLVPFFWSIHQR